MHQVRVPWENGQGLVLDDNTGTCFAEYLGFPVRPNIIPPMLHNRSFPYHRSCKIFGIENIFNLLAPEFGI